MFRKISYTILTVAFLIGSYSIAQQVDPEITPSASASAGECEATASASLSISGIHFVNETNTWVGDGHASAGVIYVFRDDVIDRDPEDENGDPILGRITVTVEVTTKLMIDGSLSPSGSTTATGKGSAKVKAGIPQIAGGAEVEGEGSISRTETTGTDFHIELGFEKKRGEPIYETRDAKVTGSKRNGKWSYAYASYGGLSSSDCGTYTPSLLTLLNPFSGSGS